MYSPKIREDLVPLIYQAAKESRVAMTVWVNKALEQALIKPSNNEPLNLKEQPTEKYE
jgi:hypothetical protein